MGRARMLAILAALRATLARLLTLLLPLSLLIADAAATPAPPARALAAQPGPIALGPARARGAGLPQHWMETGSNGRLPTASQASPAADRTGDRSRTMAGKALATAARQTARAAELAPVTPIAAGADAATPAQTWPALRSSAPLQAGAASETSQALATGEAASQQPASPLERRLQQWPAWRLPAPLTRPGRQAPLWPAWFSGEWQVESTPLPAAAAAPPPPSPPWRARFRPDGEGRAVAERACNALAVGRSLLGAQLLSVQDDPRNPQRQLARLAGDRLLETTLIGQRGEQPEPDQFLNDELSLQVLHGPGEPRLSRIETLGRWHRLADGSIEGEQWQARYASPAEGLTAPSLASDHWRLRLVPVPPGSDRATETAAPATDCR